VVRMTNMPERLAQGVAERVVSLVVSALDLDALLARVDLNALLDRVDVARVMDRVDVDALLARVDIEGLIGRVDLDALLDRIDIQGLVARVDLASTMSSTAASAADDALGALRMTAARGDALTARWADRVIGRR
jgi:hypothetical protein